MSVMLINSLWKQIFSGTLHTHSIICEILFSLVESSSLNRKRVILFWNNQQSQHLLQTILDKVTPNLTTVFIFGNHFLRRQIRQMTVLGFEHNWNMAQIDFSLFNRPIIQNPSNCYKKWCRVSATRHSTLPRVDSCISVSQVFISSFTSYLFKKWILVTDKISSVYLFGSL